MVLVSKPYLKCEEYVRFSARKSSASRKKSPSERLQLVALKQTSSGVTVK